MSNSFYRKDLTDAQFCKVHQSACSGLKNQATGTSRGGKTVLADKAYSCDKIRNYLEEHGAYDCIPDKANFKTNHDFDSELYKQRNIVDNLPTTPGSIFFMSRVFGIRNPTQVVFVQWKALNWQGEFFLLRLSSFAL